MSLTRPMTFPRGARCGFVLGRMGRRRGGNQSQVANLLCFGWTTAIVGSSPSFHRTTLCRRARMTVSQATFVYRFDTHIHALGLDDEYRYWAFIEMHPAHIPRVIVEGARKDAIDVLHWSYTDRLLTHPNLPPTPPPFSQDECIELLKLLNGESPDLFGFDSCLTVSFRLESSHWCSIHSDGRSYSSACW